MRLSEYCSAQDIDRAIAVTVDSFISSQKVSAKKALSRAFAKYVIASLPISGYVSNIMRIDTRSPAPSPSPSAALASPSRTRICHGMPLRRGKQALVDCVVSFMSNTILSACGVIGVYV